ncbi:MAG: hypothetical protein ABSF45_03075 [Terriglobia bacterium]|jgi:hypothetical protein
MKRLNRDVMVFAMLAGLILVAALLACSNNSTPEVHSVPAPRASKPNMTDARRLSDGANKLMDAMNKPKTSFHFSFKGQENINDKFIRDQTQQPQVGPVALQADISPEEISLTETRGSTTKTSKAKKGDEMNWAMANLTTLGTMTSPNFVIAVASAVAAPPSTDLVGATPADKFTFDTTTATPSQKMGLDAARMVLTTIKDCKGTAWIAKESGLLIKFNVDADYLDKYNRAWKEHYEGEVTPK